MGAHICGHCNCEPCRCAADATPERAGTMNTLLEMVERFNRQIIGVPIPDRPTILSYQRSEARLSHMREELTEIEDAFSDECIADVTDGVIDLAYVALGTLIEMGITAGAAFEEVHVANMKRERGHNPSRPDTQDHDAVKPAGWTPPDIEKLLSITRADVDWLVENRVRETDLTDPRIDGSFRFKDWSKKRLPKLLVIGHARHGKDTICEALRDIYGFRFTSSSLFCAERVMLPYFALTDVVYHTAEECFEDRMNHRDEWYQAIRDFNRPDATALAQALFKEHDVYCGLRSSAELHAGRNVGLFDHVIWVDASQRVPPEPRTSCTVEPWMADHVVDANGTIDDTKFNLQQLMGRLLT